MSTVEDRIVEMKFENGTFMRNAAATLGILDRLKASLGSSFNARSVNELQAASNRFNMSGMSNAVGDVTARLSAMSTIGIAALATLTSKAVSSGLAFARSFTIGPIADGFSDYGQKLTSVQTITNATGLSVQKVNGYFTQLDQYADKTVFNLTDMTSALAKFTNAGVDLDVSVPAIKGIANMTALAGQGAGEAAIAFYNLSQSIGNGFMTTSDFRSLNLANVATKEWKDQMIEGAIAAGTLKRTGKDTFEILADGSKKGATSAQLFQEELSRGWASAEVLTDVLGKYGDEQTAIGKKAQAAAQDVKSLPMMIDTLKAAVGTGWTDTFEIVLGDLNESKELFTGLTNSIGGWLGGMSKARNELLGGWKELGGRTVLIKAFSNAFQVLGDIIHPIKLAFRDIFPATTSKELFNATVAVRNFFKGLFLGEDTMDNIRRTARGFFAVLDIGWQIVKQVAGVFGDLFGAMGDGSGDFLNFTGNVGDFLVALDEAIKNGEGLTKFFDGISAVLQVPIRLFGALVGVLSGVTDVSEGMDGALGRVQERFGPLGVLVKFLTGAWDIFFEAMEKVFEMLGPFTDQIAQLFSGFGDAIANSMSSGNFDALLDLINTGLLGGILLLVKKFFSNGINVDLGGGLLKEIKGTFGQLTDSMKAMQTQIQAKTLLLIAGAIALLTASVVALSLIDSGNLTKALTAMTIAFTQLMGALFVLVKISGSAGFVKVPLIAGALVLLAAAMVEMSVAVALMGSLKWETIAKGLTGIGGALVVIALGMSLMPKGMLLRAAAIAELAVAFNAIAVAIALLGSLKWITIGKGLVAIAGALVVIAGAMSIMPKGMLLQAAALVAIAGAVNVIALAVAGLGQLGWENIAKGLVALGGSLLILAGGLTLMNGTIMGAIALRVAAKAIATLAIVLAGLGLMSWESIAKGLITLAAALAIIGAAGLLLAPVVVPLLGLGLALTGIGAGLALVGVAALAFATAFSIFTAAGSAGVIVFTGLLKALVDQIPLTMQRLGEGLVAFVNVIANSGEAFVNAFKTMFLSGINAAIAVIPRFGQLLITLVHTGLTVLRETAPEWIQTGWDLLIKFLKGFTKNLDEITETVTKMVEKFVETMGSEENIARLATAALQFIVNLVNGIAIAIDNQTEALIQAGKNIAGAVGKGMLQGAAEFSPAGMVFDMGKGLINKIKGDHDSHSPSREMMKVGRDFVEGFRIGVDDEMSSLDRSVTQMGSGLLETVSVTLAKVSDTMSGPLQLTPTISPILDLTNLSNEASKIGALLGDQAVVGGVSLGQGNAISNAQLEADNVEVTAPVQTKEVKFEQNITSPKALSPVEVYRNTKSLLSLAEEALNS